MTALGLIETKGLLAAVASADVMLKTADVRLLEKHHVGGGLVTVTVAGEVAAVKICVEAASAAVRRIREQALVSAHVIARPDPELAKIMAPGGSFAAAAASSGGGAQAETGAKTAAGAVTGAKSMPRDVDLLKKMSIAKLRGLALGLDGLPLTKGEVASASRTKLLEAITRVYGK